jgi:hypothetical protein
MIRRIAVVFQRVAGTTDKYFYSGTIRYGGKVLGIHAGCNDGWTKDYASQHFREFVDSLQSYFEISESWMG